MMEKEIEQNCGFPYYGEILESAANAGRHLFVLGFISEVDYGHINERLRKYRERCDSASELGEIKKLFENN